MSRKHKRKKWRVLAPAPGIGRCEPAHVAAAMGTATGVGASAAKALDGSSVLSSPEAAAVRESLAKGNTKSAVELAKQIHKRLGTSTSEAILVEAYSARVRSMLDRNMVLEAKARLELVRERYPSAGERLGDVKIALAARQGSLEDLVRPLNDPAISP